MEQHTKESLLRYIQSLSNVVERHEVILEELLRQARAHPDPHHPVPANLKTDANWLAGELRGNMEKLFKIVLEDES